MIKDTAEVAGLRTMLKDVNVAYSTLLRSESREDRLPNLERLKRQRQALMSRIAELRTLQHLEMLPVSLDGWQSAKPIGSAVHMGGAASDVAVS